MLQLAGKTYELIRDHKNGWNADIFRERYSEILDRYDYIVGDWGYNQLRLKGFYNDQSNKANKESAFSYVEDYIVEHCNFGCAHFILKRVKSAKPAVVPEKTEKQEQEQNA